MGDMIYGSWLKLKVFQSKKLKQHKDEYSPFFFLLAETPRGGGVLPEKLGRGGRPASQNPYPIYDQNLRFSLPYL